MRVPVANAHTCAARARRCISVHAQFHTRTRFPFGWVLRTPEVCVGGAPLCHEESLAQARDPSPFCTRLRRPGSRTGSVPLKEVGCSSGLRKRPDPGLPLSALAPQAPLSLICRAVGSSSFSGDPYPRAGRWGQGESGGGGGVRSQRLEGLPPRPAALPLPSRWLGRTL